MLYRLSVGVHFEDIDTGDSDVMRVVVEQIPEIHACPHVIADCDDVVDDNACALRPAHYYSKPTTWRRIASCSASNLSRTNRRAL
jgi:hypothetical protein